MQPVAMGIAETKTPREVTGPDVDLVTVASIAMVAYAISNVLHEGVGHGLISILVEGKAQVLSSMNYVGDHQALPGWAVRLVSAGGTLVNLAAGLLAMIFLKRICLRSHWQYFFWVFAAVNLFVGTGYLMFSGFAGIGDWENVIAGLPYYWAWRAALAVFGTISYGFAMYWLMCLLGPMLVREPGGRMRTAYKLCLVPYIAGGALYVIAGLFHPAGARLLLISAVAASFGGTCGFVWAPQFLLNPNIPHAGLEPLRLCRSWSWIISGLVVAAAFVAILGPGIRLSPP